MIVLIGSEMKTPSSSMKKKRPNHGRGRTPRLVLKKKRGDKMRNRDILIKKRKR